jgi:hypothetical protein
MRDQLGMCGTVRYVLGRIAGAAIPDYLEAKITSANGHDLSFRGTPILQPGILGMRTERID